MSILSALNSDGLNQPAFNHHEMNRLGIIAMSRLHVDNLGILYTTNGVYAKKFFGIPTAGRWNYEASGLYFGTPTILVGLYEVKSPNLTWCAKDLKTGKLLYLPYWFNRPLIWKEHIIPAS